eukprot:TRINITY_DN4811_c0_g1_i1.p1 TRINITY_DN4811_c0_g1~~TRINITY_DN4811_c0_g1_i1.p1  ORF type:complete len:340 (+),score=65.75 TRINITY_DN4811_c0_g1_i1:25-1020(+)
MGLMRLWFLALLAAVVRGEIPQEYDTIAVGDLHGDLYHTVATLFAAGVIDHHGHWAADRRTVIQVGDVVDRGDDGRFLYDYLSELREEASLHGGRVIQLLGNHELMNFEGYLRYVSPGDVQTYGGERNRAEEWAATGRLGYLRHLPVAYIHHDSVFVHAGISEYWANLGVDEINHRAQQAILAESWKDPLLGYEDSVLWNRNLYYASAKGRCNLVEASLQALTNAEGKEIRRMVVGHTIQKGGKVSQLCGGKLLAIDIAISKACGGGYAGAVLLSDDLTVPVKVVPQSPSSFPRAVVQRAAERVRARICHFYRQKNLYVPDSCPAAFSDEL